MQERLLSASYASLPGECEDSFAMQADSQNAFLCVADGCGGLGSRRYPALDNHTGAYIAARLATRSFLNWAQERRPMPDTPEMGAALCRELEGDLSGIFRHFADKHCRELPQNRIVGSMQRTLPCTFCAAVTQESTAILRDICFFWAGDSRGYLLDAQGLHQCTEDHLRSQPDAFESLYRDTPLTSLLCACQPIHISLRRLRAPLPCAVLTLTDGVFGCLSSPMELEMLLLNTLRAASSWESWQRKLCNQFKKLCHDDATLLCQPCGATDFSAFKALMAARRTVLQKQYVTPVRRHGHELAFAREKWRAYRQNYDWTQGGRHERADWRI